MNLPEVARLEHQTLLHAFSPQGLPRPLSSRGKARQALPGLLEGQGGSASLILLRVLLGGSRGLPGRGANHGAAEQPPRAAEAPG